MGHSFAGEYALAKQIWDPLNQFLAKGFSYGFGFGVDLKLLVDVFEMKRNRVERDAHFAGSGFFVMPVDKELQELRFLWC